MTKCPICGSEDTTRTGVFIDWDDGEVLLSYICHNRRCNGRIPAEGCGYFQVPPGNEAAALAYVGLLRVGKGPENGGGA